jgi:hypothetical protein
VITLGPEYSAVDRRLSIDRVDRLWEELDTVDPGTDPMRVRELLTRIDQELFAAEAELASGRNAS